MKPHQLQFSGLIHYPHSSHFGLMGALDGVAQINHLSREEDHYASDISFDDFMGLAAALAQHNGHFVNVKAANAPSSGLIAKPAKAGAVAKYEPRGTKRRVIARLMRSKDRPNSKKAELRKFLTGKTWHPMDDIVKAVKQKQSSVQARFTAFRADGILEQKESGGRQVYRITAKS